MKKMEKKFDDKITNIQKQIDDGAKTSPGSAVSTAASACGSERSTPAPKNLSERFAEEKVERVWHPGFVRLQGFCTDWITRKGALSAKTADNVF